MDAGAGAGPSLGLVRGRPRRPVCGRAQGPVRERARDSVRRAAGSRCATELGANGMRVGSRASVRRVRPTFDSTEVHNDGAAVEMGDLLSGLLRASAVLTRLTLCGRGRPGSGRLVGV
ncbi:hypothetical protein GCM10027203_59670 [Nonomuraea fastidiosa]